MNLLNTLRAIEAADTRRLDATRVIVRGETTDEITLAEFFAVNDWIASDAPELTDEIRSTIARGKTFRGGGGSEPEWSVEPARAA